MMRPPFSLLSLLLSWKLVAAVDRFVYPPTFGSVGEYVSDLSFKTGQRIALRWAKDGTTGDEVSLWLIRDGGTNSCAFQSNAQCEQIAWTPNNGSINWTVDRLGMAGSLFYISAYYLQTPTNSASDTHFNAHYINITDPAPATPTITKPSTSTSIRATGSATQRAHPTDPPLSPAPPGPSSRAALGVGLGLGIPLGLAAVAGVVWVLLRASRARRRRAVQAEGAAARMYAAPPVANVVHEVEANEYKPPPQELMGN